MRSFRLQFTDEQVFSRGFTRIELIVVMAIVAVLISVILPSIQITREAARHLQCRNNLRQLAIGKWESRNRSEISEPILTLTNPGTKNVNDSDTKLFFATVFA